MSEFVTATGELTPAGYASFLAHTTGAKTLEELNRHPVSDGSFWLVPDLVCSSLTLLYGESKAGKSLFVCQLVRSLVDGRPVLGRAPAVKGRVLILCSDAGAVSEYQHRLTSMGVRNAQDVVFVPVATGINAQLWEDLTELASVSGFCLVVLDHATGVLEGDVNAREPWRDLWQHLIRLGTPALMVSHSSDSRYQGARSHRPMGNSAATQWARHRVEYTRPDRRDSNKRVLRLMSNQVCSDSIAGVIDESTGLLSLDDEVTQPPRVSDKQQRNALIASLLVEDAPGRFKTSMQALEWVVTQPGVADSELSPATVRNMLSRLGVSWDKSQRKYVRAS